MTLGLCCGIATLDLFALEDDRHYFPPYEAVPVIWQQTIQEHPEGLRVLADLEGKISDAQMQQMNYAVDGWHRRYAGRGAGTLARKKACALTVASNVRVVEP